MAPRKRSERKRDFPDNLYESGGFYRWRHPRTKRDYGLGSDKAKAFKEAKRANLHLAMEQPAPTLVDRITGKVDTWGDWMDDFEKLLAKRKLADNTRRTYASLLNKARALAEPTAPFSSVTTKVIAKALGTLEDAGKARQAQQFRSFMKDCFNDAIGEGWTKENPALVVRAIDVEVKRARLQFDVFMAVYEAEQTPWAKNCYALALVSGQDRESCANATFKAIRDGAWWNERGKTGARIVIPLELRLNCFGMSLDDVVRQCRATGVLSRYLIHQTQNYGNSKAGAQIWINTITRHFTDTLASLNLDFAPKEPPTFHEIRSLSERLYAEQGNVKTQELLGHKDAKTTALYHDARGEWVRVSITG
jgi:integrase